MKIIDWDFFLRSGLNSNEPVSFTIGVFDGVHRGHIELINCLLNQPDTFPVLATFRQNPFLLLRPDSFKGNIFSLDSKLEALGEAGCSTIILIDFSLEFSKLSGREFLSHIRKHLNLNHLVLGKDHRLGFKGDTSSLQAKNMLEPEGIKVDIVEPIIDDGIAVSSTRIRTAVEEGNLSAAERLLGRKFFLDLKEISWKHDENGTPCIWRNDIKQVIPAAGEYAAELESGEYCLCHKNCNHGRQDKC